MTDITPQIPEGKKVIEAYGNGGFKVTGERYSHNILIFPDKIFKFEAERIETTMPEHIQEVLNDKEVEILLVGGGIATDFFLPQTEAILKQKRISVEYMDTGAAARTYNVLLSEERKVAVILIAV